MRALLDLGIEKRLRSFLAMANNAGLPLFQNLKAPSEAERTLTESHKLLFEKELGGL